MARSSLEASSGPLVSSRVADLIPGQMLPGNLSPLGLLLSVEALLERKFARQESLQARLVVVLFARSKANRPIGEQESPPPPPPTAHYFPLNTYAGPENLVGQDSIRPLRTGSSRCRNTRQTRFYSISQKDGLRQAARGVALHPECAEWAGSPKVAQAALAAGWSSLIEVPARPCC